MALGNRFERKRDTLASADAQGDDPALETVALHRMKQASRQHRARGTDRMPMRDCAALNIDDVRTTAAQERNSNAPDLQGASADRPASAPYRIACRLARPRCFADGV